MFCTKPCQMGPAIESCLAKLGQVKTGAEELDDRMIGAKLENNSAVHPEHFIASREIITGVIAANLSVELTPCTDETRLYSATGCPKADALAVTLLRLTDLSTVN